MRRHRHVLQNQLHMLYPWFSNFSKTYLIKHSLETATFINVLLGSNFKLKISSQNNSVCKKASGEM